MPSPEILGKISMRSDHEVEWVIEDFFSYKEIVYASPHFNINGAEWIIMICPNGYTSDNTTEWISLYLFTEKVVSPVGVSFAFGLKKVDGSIEYRHPELVWVYEKNDICGKVKFLERSELQRREAEFMLSNTLTVTCRLLTMKDFESSLGLGTLSQDLANMFLSKKCCDATLNVKGEEFPVHRSILSARSSVFDTMFEVEMKEKRTGTVDIPDCDPESFREFLLYIYTDKIEKVPSDACELFKIADKYNVENLKSYCAMYILLNLSVDNVLDAYSLGIQYSIEEVIIKTQIFFNEHFSKILQTANWKEFLVGDTTTANELLTMMAKEMENKK